jgi:cysteine desulfurase
MNERVYLDYAATTPLDERVLAVMLPYFTATFGNPSSVHVWGQAAEAALEEARAGMARRLNAAPEEVIFTGCGTESDNLALRGTAHAMRKARGAAHLLISPVEHHAVTHTAHQLAEEGFSVEMLPVDGYGRVDPADIANRLRADTALVSVIYANNEIGTINPVAAIGRVCRERGVPFHTDAVQAAAHLKMDVEADCVDLLSLGAHKFYGPKGVGALYVRKGTPLETVQTGGGQERGLRAGTQNIPYIVGMAEAFRLAQEGAAERRAAILPLRGHLIGSVLENIPQAQLTGHPEERLPNHASFVFQGVDGNQLLMMLDVAGFGCSSGSACKTGSPKPSEVLTALGLADDWALGSLRVTLGRDTTPQALQAFLAALPGLVAAQRKLRG